MEPKILLINAPAENMVEKHYAHPPNPRIGLGYLASFLKFNKIECDVIDAKYERFDFKHILKRLKKQNYDIVGFNSMTNEIITTAKLASLIKNEKPRIINIIGGPHASALPVGTLKEFDSFDLACFGEGEKVLYETVCALRMRNSLEGLKGLAYREGNVIKQNKPMPFIEDLDELPPPAWELFSPARAYPILASRGCIGRCNFCMRALGDQIRFRTPELVVEEMKDTYDRYKPGIFVFCDETFGIDKDSTSRLLKGIINNGLNKKVKWYAATRVDIVNKELLKEMKQAGCDRIDFGIESGNENILKETNKNITKEKAQKAVFMAKKENLATGSYFILGHPGETKKTLEETISFALKLNTTAVSFGMMVPYPGTEIARIVEKGAFGYKLLAKNWDAYNKQTSAALELEGVDRNMLQKYQLMGYLKFYLFKPNISKIKHLFSNYSLKTLLFMLLSRIFKIGRAN